MVKRSLIIASITMMSLVLMVGVSVVGLLQSTERVGSSGIVVQPPPPLIPPPPPSGPSPPPPPEPTIEIDVYSDSALTQVLTNVVWGEIEAGSSGSQIVYIHNSGDDGVTLGLMTENWSPAEASSFMQLSWNYDGSVIDSGDVRQITLVLSVSSSITGIDSFYFDIVIIGSAL